MRLELEGGIVVNTWPDDSARGDWYPDDTVISQIDDRGSRINPHAPLRVDPEQPQGWPERAGRRWDGRAWALAPDHDARKQVGLERSAKREAARKRSSTDLDIYERVADLEKRMNELEQRPAGTDRG